MVLLLNDNDFFPVIGHGPDPSSDRFNGIVGVLMMSGQQIPEPSKAHRRPQAQGGSRVGGDVAGDNQLRYLRSRFGSTILERSRLVQEPLLLLPRRRGQRG